MDNRLRFRAWANKDKCMLDWLCICQTAFNRVDDGNYGLMYRILTNQAEPNDGYGYVIMPSSGLNDKGKMEREIYDGDLIRFADKFTYEVRFEDGKFVCYHVKTEWGKWGDLKRLSDPDFQEYHHEVIGNIYENPDLLTTNPLK